MCTYRGILSPLYLTPGTPCLVITPTPSPIHPFKSQYKSVYECIHLAPLWFQLMLPPPLVGLVFPILLHPCHLHLRSPLRRSLRHHLPHYQEERFHLKGKRNNFGKKKKASVSEKVKFINVTYIKHEQKHLFMFCYRLAAVYSNCQDSYNKS